MPRPTFAGASVRQFNAQAGWGVTGVSQMNIALAEDPSNGDVFISPTVGEPAYFNFGTFSFSGLTKQVSESRGTDGYPVYDIVLVDPREILSGTQVILGGYAGSVLSVFNCLNVYNWWESQGFGLAQSDESGMPWGKIAHALTAILGQPLQTEYGGPLRYRGFTYGLDVSELPTPPADYRVGATLSISLLELIAIICEDGGYDFMVDLTGSAIRIRTVSRRTAPPLGTLQAIAEARTGVDLIRYQRGVESRTEPTSVILFGAEKRDLHQSLSVNSFWGYDTLGLPIIGAAGRLDLVDSRYYCTLSNQLPADATSTAANTFTEVVAGQSLDWSKLAAPFELLVDNGGVFVGHPPAGVGSVDSSRFEVIRVNQHATNQVAQPTAFFGSLSRGRHNSTPVSVATYDRLYLSYGSVQCEFMTLNSSPVADVVGSTSYATSTFELRLAKGNFNAWAVYLAHYRPDVATLVGILSPFRNKKGVGDKLPVDLIDDSSVAALRAAAALNGDAQAKVMRLYEWLRGYADEYMGRKFLVPLPAVSYARDSETLRLRSSYEIDEGAWLDEGLTPLSLPARMQDAFKTQDGRFRAAVRYGNVSGADFSLVSPESTVIDPASERFWSLVDVDQNLVLTSPNPCALVTVPGPVNDPVIDSLGDADLLRATLQLTQGESGKVFAKASFGNLGIKLAPASRTPEAAVVPLKSNVETYGPWVAAGVAGPVRVEHDQSLAPWFFGGNALMERVGRARVDLSIMNALAVETGLLEFAGAPTASLGDTLAEGGPPITGVQMSYGQSITTTYQFQTFTPRFGIFTRNNAERLKKISLAQAQLRRANRSVGKAAAAQGVQTAAAAKVVRKFAEEAPKVLQKQSPHEVLVAECYADQSLGRVRTGVATLTLEEAIGAVSAENPSGYRSHAAVSWAGILRPFSTQISASGLTPPSGMPQYQNLPNWASGGIGRDTLDPWKSQNDIEVYAHGPSYNGLTGSGRVPTDARPLGLRGPLLLTGFGYDTEGYPVPGNGSGAFASGHLTQPETWKCGPVDSLWDQRRGVWTSHDVLKGKVKTTISSSLGSGLVQVWHNGSGIPWDVAAYNWSGTALSSGTNVHLLFNVLDRRWYAHSASASGSSGLEIQVSSHLGNFYSPAPRLAVFQNFTMQIDGGDLNYIYLAPAAASGSNWGVVSDTYQFFQGQKHFANGTVTESHSWVRGDISVSGSALLQGAFIGALRLGGDVLTDSAFSPTFGHAHVGADSLGFYVSHEEGGMTGWGAFTQEVIDDSVFFTFRSPSRDCAYRIVMPPAPFTAPGDVTYTGLTGANLLGDSFVGGIVHQLQTDPTTARGNLGLGSMATEDAGDFLTGNQTITLSGDVTGAGATAITTTIADDAVTYAKMQDVSAGDKLLGRISGAGSVEEIDCTAAGRTLIGAADASAQQTALSLVPGTHVQAQDAELQAIADLTSDEDTFPYFTGLGTAALATLTGLARNLLDDETATEMRATLEIPDPLDPGDFEVPLTFSNGVTRVGDNVSVDLVQYITKLSNLTSNGFVRASGGDGTLWVDTAAYLTGNETITLGGDVTGAGVTAIVTTIADDAVTYAKMQDVSATDRVLGRSSSGAGDVEEIACTAAGRALLDDADAAAQRATLSVPGLTTNNQLSGAYQALANGDTSAGGTTVLYLGRTADTSGDVIIEGFHGGGGTATILLNSLYGGMVETGGDLKVNGLAASRFVATDANKKLVSIAPDTGWSTSNVTPDRALDANATSLDEVADVLCTLIEALKTQGLLGA